MCKRQCKDVIEVPFEMHVHDYNFHVQFQILQYCRTCTDCISKECGFCYWDLPSGVTNGSCWEENPDNPSSYPLSGICNATAMHANTGLVWADDWCPSRYSWLAVAALGIYLLFFAPGNKPNVL
jgi:hypothetical protein